MELDNLVFEEGRSQTQHIVRILNTNIDGKKQLQAGLTDIRGIGTRMAIAIIKRAGLDPRMRVGELNETETEKLLSIIVNPLENGIPSWMLNSQRDVEDGKDKHLIGNQIDAALRFWIEKGKKVKYIRVDRLTRGLKVRGQRTKSNGRKGRVMGVSRKK